MKKHFLIAAIAIGLASCTSEEEIVTPQADTPISFKAVSKKASRSAISNTSLVGSNTTIYVAGLLAGSTSTLQFKNEEFKNDDSGTFSSAQNWPSDGKLSMWGYSCAKYKRSMAELNGVKTLVEVAEKNLVLSPTEAVWENDGDKFTTMTLRFSDKLKGETDVMYSTLAGTVNLNCAANPKPSPSMKLQHALAWITINFTSGNAGDLMKIYGVKFTDLKLSGDLVVTANAEGNSIQSAEWTPYQTTNGTDDSADTFISQFGDGDDENKAHLLGDVIGAVQEGILVLPQQQTKLVIYYALKDANSQYNNILTHEIDLNPNNGTATWDGGHKYLYKISINQDKITFSAAVEPWVESTETEGL